MSLTRARATKIFLSSSSLSARRATVKVAEAVSEQAGGRPAAAVNLALGPCSSGSRNGGDGGGGGDGGEGGGAMLGRTVVVAAHSPNLAWRRRRRSAAAAMATATARALMTLAGCRRGRRWRASTSHGPQSPVRARS